MVLGEPGNRIAELVSEPGLLRDLGKNFCCRFFGVARPHQIEDAKFHRPFLCFATSVSVAAMTRGRQARYFSAADADLSGAGPRVRIRLPPAGSQLRT